jgi:hypothetical protein
VAVDRRSRRRGGGHAAVGLDLRAVRAPGRGHRRARRPGARAMEPGAPGIEAAGPMRQSTCRRSQEAAG